LCAVSLLLGASACAQVASTPEPGTQERHAILDAARAPVEAALDVPVLFKVSTLRSDGHWSFLTATPLGEDHEPIDYSQTQFADEVRDGVFEDRIHALLRKEPGEDWAVVELAIGATDAPFVDWPHRYGAPKALIVPEPQPE
jgi:hypothetical protein